jgi:uncharacterized lipoprotein YddW (UPF0748 family)
MAPMSEVRALWVVRNDLTSPERIQHVVQTAKEYGFNTLFVQVRGRGDAYYDSSYEPRAEELAGEPASFDPLATIIQQGHAAGLQIHAWVNTTYVWSAGRKPSSENHIINAHPDWLETTSDGVYHLSAAQNCEGAFLSPANPEVRQHLHDVFMEIVKNYDIDGLHFDYIRYPNRQYDYSSETIEMFADYMRPCLPMFRQNALDEQGDVAYVHAYPDQWADWRRDQLTSLEESVYHDVKAVKPWVCVSAAVFANWDDAYNERGQDWKRWLRDGTLDAVIPMAYSASTPMVSAQIKDAEDTASACGRACYAGIGAWHIPAASTLDKIAAARADGAQGIVIFSFGGVTNDGSDDAYIAKIDSHAFQLPATLPHIGSVAARPSSEQATMNTPTQSRSDQASGQAS